MDHLKRYNASATEEGGWARYVADYVDVSEAQYQEKAGGLARITQLKPPVF